MTGKQLRNSILQWAIQGKLVPQDPNDEPASVLLERIRAEKARLVKEKKIKKDKNESIIFRGEDNSYYEKMTDDTVRCIDSEIPFDIPESWEWVRLGNIVSVGGGKRIPAGRKLTKEVTPQIYIRVSDMKNGEISDQDLHYVPNDIIPLISRYTISSDDIYITVAGTIGKIGIVPSKFDGANLTENADKLIIPEYNKLFLVLTLESPFVQQQISAVTTKVGQPKLAIARIENLLIPVVPKEEQLRIVSRFKTLKPLINAYDNSFIKMQELNDAISRDLYKSILQEAIQGRLVPQIDSEGTAEELLAEIRAEKERLVKEDKLKKSALANESRIFRGEDNRYYEQIGETITEIDVPFELPNNWAFTRLGNLCQLTDGDKREGIEVSLDAKYLRGKGISHIAKGRFIEKGEQLILVDGENSGEVFTAPIAGYLGSTFKKLWIAPSMRQNFVLLFLRLYKELLRNYKKGAAIPHLNKELFYALIIGIPPIKEQIRIVNRVSELFKVMK